MKCELLVECLFFNDQMADMPVIADIYKETYCRGDNTVCARYIVFKALGRERIPPDLFPNQRNRALSMVSANA